MLARGSFPKAGLLLGFGGGFSNIWRIPKSLAGNCEARQVGSLGDEARDVGSSPGSSIPEWPWASLWFYFLALSFSISKIKGLNKMLSKGFPSSKILIFYKWDSGLFKTFFFSCLEWVFISGNKLEIPSELKSMEWKSFGFSGWKGQRDSEMYSKPAPSAWKPN